MADMTQEELEQQVREKVRQAKSHLSRFKQNLDGYAPVLLIAGSTVLTALATRRGAATSKDLLKVNKETLDVTQALNTNLLTLIQTVQDELWHQDNFRSRVGADVDRFTKEGTNFTFYPGVGVRPDGLLD